MGWLSHGMSAFDPACLSRPWHGHIIRLPHLSCDSPPSGGLLSLCRSRLGVQLAECREHGITIEYVRAAPAAHVPAMRLQIQRRYAEGGRTVRTLRYQGHICSALEKNGITFSFPSIKSNRPFPVQAGYRTRADRLARLL